MLEYRTEGFNSYAVKYSPFFDSRIAVAASQNYGIVGNGRLYVLGLTPKGIVAEKWFNTQDALFDLSWSEAHENQVLVAGGDGSVKLFDIGINEFPIKSWKEHMREVFAVHWNLVSKDIFCSSSWDGTVRVWNPTRPTSLLTLPTHSCTYSASFTPHSPSLLSAVASDSHFRLFDLRTPSSASNHLVLSIPIHAAQAPTQLTPNPFPAFPPHEALTHDWNKYRSSIVATAGVDRLIRTFDIRAPGQGPLVLLPGHEYTVRRVTWSPHLADTLLSASYDMSCRIWTDGTAKAEPPLSGSGGVGGQQGRELGRMDRHTEFVCGVDWCLFGSEGWAASAAWDERLCVWDVRQFMGPRRG